jgi:Zn-dependent M28 family amino/carboxypeptidase
MTTRSPATAPRAPRRVARATSALLTMLLVAVLLPATSTAAPRGGSGGGPASGAACDNRDNNTYDKLLECVTVDGAMRHLEAFQAIADANDDTRASGTSGYDASADYVADQLTSAGYDVEVQDFQFPFFEELAEPAMSIETADGTVDYEPDEDFITMSFSGSGDVTAPVTHVPDPDPDDPAVGAGCTADQFVDFPAGDVALIERGVCAFGLKAANAQDADASAVVIYNNADPVFAGTLGGVGYDIPVVGTSRAVGLEIRDEAETLSITTETLSEVRDTVNVFAETPGGRDDNVVMVGAHLDSVPAGPGINDNGSGSAALIEVAQKMRKVDVENKVRFAWWGAEEFGLLGSYHYTDGLVESGEIEDIALYLNFDMVASPNYVRFIYDGDGSAFGLEGPDGSAAIEELYEDFYGHRDLAWEPTQISFRSDYAGFFYAGVPFGGLFTGAEGVKTAEEVEIYGGVEGEWYDPCYHRACDDIDNLSTEVFDLNLDAIAFSTLTYAYSTESVNGEVGVPVPGKPSGVFGSRADAPAGAGTQTHSGGGGLHPERDPDHHGDHDHDHDHHRELA